MDCNNCRYDYKSYHCLDCDNFNSDLDTVKPFCSYCNYKKNSTNCNNCVYKNL